MWGKLGVQSLNPLPPSASSFLTPALYLTLSSADVAEREIASYVPEIIEPTFAKSKSKDQTHFKNQAQRSSPEIKCKGLPHRSNAQIKRKDLAQR